MSESENDEQGQSNRTFNKREERKHKGVITQTAAWEHTNESSYYSGRNAKKKSSPSVLIGKGHVS
jgi:hypothetical protein